MATPLTRSRGAAIAHYNEGAEGRRLAETLAEEQELSKENEELLRREATAKLARVQERRAHNKKAKTRAAQARLGVEAE